MYKIYEKWHTIAKKAYQSDYDLTTFSSINHIVFAGMGGSGSLGDVFASILSKTPIHVSVVKGYLLPNTVDSNTLVVTTSISGNTIETLTVLDTAKKKDCSIIAFSSGGKMMKFCETNKILHNQITQFHSQRTSFTSFLYSMLKMLREILPVKTSDVLESINELDVTNKLISSNNLTKDNPALSLAEWMKNIPVIYYPFGLQAAAIRFKNLLQENAKQHAMIEDVIEASHNGIVSWENPSNVNPILLEGEDDYVKTKERWAILKEYFEMNEIDYKEVFSGIFC